MNAIKSITVVINPTAGNDTGARIRPEVERTFKQNFPQHELVFTESGGKPDAIALGAETAADLLVVLSGDGTLHDIAQGVLSRPRESRPAITIIPIGSGNDFARTLGVSADPLQAIRELRTGVRVNADVGRCNQTWYLETLSFGVDAAVAISTIDLRKSTRTRGALLYAHAAVLAIIRELKAHRVRYNIDGQLFDDDLLILAVQNGPTYGGGFHIAPRASITDGSLDVCTGKKVGVLRALFYLARIFGGKHEHYPTFDAYRAKNLIIDFDEPVPTQCDGEAQDGMHFEVSVVPQALDVIVPVGSPVLKAALGTTAGTEQAVCRGSVDAGTRG